MFLNLNQGVEQETWKFFKNNQKKRREKGLKGVGQPQKIGIVDTDVGKQNDTLELVIQKTWWWHRKGQEDQLKRIRERKRKSNNKDMST